MEKDTRLHEPIREFHQAKKFLKDMLMTFYQIKYNRALTFKSIKKT